MANEINERQRFRDWILNGCEYFDIEGHGDNERFRCALNLTLGMTRNKMYDYCTKKCKKRIRMSRY